MKEVGQTEQSKRTARFSGMSLSFHKYKLFCVVRFVKLIGLLWLRFLGVGDLLLLALHRENNKSKICYTNGAACEHVRLE